jgi:hypothetical protein
VRNNLKIIGGVLIVLHLAVSLLHGQAHSGAAVALTPFGYAYVLIVITLAPLAAGVLLMLHWRKSGALLLAVSMLGSFVFGAWYHFFAAGSDNVSEVLGPWHSTFAWTAAALAILELLGAVAGALILFQKPEQAEHA